VPSAPGYLPIQLYLQKLQWRWSDMEDPWTEEMEHHEVVPSVCWWGREEREKWGHFV